MRGGVRRGLPYVLTQRPLSLPQRVGSAQPIAKHVNSVWRNDTRGEMMTQCPVTPSPHHLDTTSNKQGIHIIIDCNPAHESYLRVQHSGGGKIADCASLSRQLFRIWTNCGKSHSLPTVLPTSSD